MRVLNINSGYNEMLKEDAYEDWKIEGRAEEIVETGYEFRITSEEILARLQNKLIYRPGKRKDFLIGTGGWSPDGKAA